MSHRTESNLHENEKPGLVTATPSGLATRTGLFVLFLVCAFAVFMLGVNYLPLFPTNGKWVYAASLSFVFLAAALIFKRNGKLVKYWPIAYAFFVASSVNLVSDLFAGYNRAIARLFGILTDTNQFMGLAKLYDALLVILPILVLTLLSGAGLGSLFLKKGNLNRKWGLGIGFLVLFNFFTSAIIFFGTSYQVSRLGPVILWGLVFSLSNSLLEELWVRGLFLKKLVPLIGMGGAVVLTSIWFGALHFFAVAYLPAAVIPVFVINTLTMGLACGILMLKTDSIWGAFLIHAAADLFLFIATLAVH
jgi:membrane protease YdiL (CAAX protease family)